MSGAVDWIVADLCDFAACGLQAGSDIAQDLVIIGCGGAFYVNASAFNSGLFHQSLEVELNKAFNLLSGKKRDGNTGRLAGRGFDSYVIGKFWLLRFCIQCTTSKRGRGISLQERMEVAAKRIYHRLVRRRSKKF